MGSLMRMMRDKDHETRSEVTADNQGGGGATSSDLEYPILCLEWTNEKHCLYLKSMEASFVNDLYSSMAFRKGLEHKHSLKKHALKKELPHQIKTLRKGGSWKNRSLYKFRSKTGSFAEMSDQNFGDQVVPIRDFTTAAEPEK